MPLNGRKRSPGISLPAVQFGSDSQNLLTLQRYYGIEGMEAPDHVTTEPWNSKHRDDAVNEQLLAHQVREASPDGLHSCSMFEYILVSGFSPRSAQSDSQGLLARNLESPPDSQAHGRTRPKTGVGELFCPQIQPAMVWQPCAAPLHTVCSKRDLGVSQTR